MKMKFVFVLLGFLGVMTTAVAQGQSDPRHLYSSKVHPTPVANVLPTNNAKELRNRMVETTTGDVYFVDWQGKSKLMYIDTSNKFVSSYDGLKGNVKSGVTKFTLTTFGQNVGDWIEFASIANGASVSFDINIELNDHVKSYQINNGFVGIPSSSSPNWTSVSPSIRGTYYFFLDNYDLQIWSNRSLTKLRIRRKASVGFNTSTVNITLLAKRINYGDMVIIPTALTGNDLTAPTVLFSSSFYAWYGDNVLLDGKTRSDNFNNSSRIIPTSRVHVNGSFSLPITNTLVGNYTATDEDYTILCDATNATFSVTLPSPVTCKGRIYVIKKVDGTANLINCNGYVINNANSSLWLQSQGSTWVKIN